MWNLRTILHPTDFSEQAASAFRVASLLARTVGARVLVLHVYPPTVCHGEVVARRQANGFHELLWQGLHKIKPPDPAVAVEHRLEEGEAGAEIVRLAREEPCDLIVMGTHGRSGLGRLLLGSVADKVMRTAPCPVLTVKLPVPEAEPVAAPPVPEAAGA